MFVAVQFGIYDWYLLWTVLNGMGIGSPPQEHFAVGFQRFSMCLFYVGLEEVAPD